MPDALHPNAAGMELLARCLSPLVDDLMEEIDDAKEKAHFWGK